MTKLLEVGKTLAAVLAGMAAVFAAQEFANLCVTIEGRDIQQFDACRPLLRHGAPRKHFARETRGNRVRNPACRPVGLAALYEAYRR